MNKNVADFEYKGRKYEIDLLLDSRYEGFITYDIFDVTDNKKGEIAGHLELDDNLYMASELIDLAIEELLENLNE